MAHCARRKSAITNQRSQIYNGGVTPFPWRRLLRIAVVGRACALAIAAVAPRSSVPSWAATTALRAGHIEAEVRSAFDLMARQLRRHRHERVGPATILAAAEDDTATATAAVRVSSTKRPRQRPTARTRDRAAIYDAEGSRSPGRRRGAAPERLLVARPGFVAQGALVRIWFYARPIDDARTALGLFAAERRSPPWTALPATRPRLRFAPRFGSVLIERRADRHGNDDVLKVAAPSGELLFPRPIPDDELAATRARWRRASARRVDCPGYRPFRRDRTRARWRNRARTPSDYTAAVLLIAALIVAARFTLRALLRPIGRDAAMYSAIGMSPRCCLRS